MTINRPLEASGDSPSYARDQVFLYSTNLIQNLQQRQIHLGCKIRTSRFNIHGENVSQNRNLLFGEDGKYKEDPR